jgi:hypothetical protein
MMGMKIGQAMVEGRQEWRKILLEAKFHNGLYQLQRRRRRRRRRSLSDCPWYVMTLTRYIKQQLGTLIIIKQSNGF